MCGARCACADVARGVVGADVPGGPRARGRPRCRPVGNGAPRTSRPTRCAHGVRVRAWCACADVACVGGYGVVRGRGRRPRRPARSWGSRCRPRCRPVGNGAPRTSRPTRCAHGVRVRTWRALADMGWCVVGADVPGGPRTRGRSRCRSVGNGAPRTSRPTRCAHGVRVRTWRALADMARCVVGADVPGGPRPRGRSRCRSVGVPLARRAPALTLPARFSRLRANKGREMPSLGGAWR